ncbi:MAG: alpha-amylase family glycosyl hydrolase [Eubacteriales bacterium]
MWLYESVFYQIYPIGFCGVSTENDGSTTSNILKVNDWIPHLQSLGANCVLFNPIFESDSHGYDTRDFSIIDKRLGSNDDFATVCHTLKENGIRIVLDGVFNHVGRGFWAFQDVLKNRQASQYNSWFYINYDGNSNYNDGFWYEGWEGHYELVKLNLHNPDVVNHLMDCVKKWIEEFDIDGLRLDVAYSLDHGFMKHLHWFTQNLKPDFGLIGEVLFGDYNIIVNNEMLHSCTNYECYKGLFSSMNDKNLFEIAHSLHRQFGGEQWSLYSGKHLMTFVDNHDVARIATILNDKNTLPVVYGILMGMPGIPCIYYGSEWGEPGEKNPHNDWGLRPCFDAPKPNTLTEYVRALLEARKNSKALCYGTYTNMTIQNQQLVFKRRCDEEEVLVAVNIVENPYTAYHGDYHGDWLNLLTNEKFTLNGAIELAPYSVMYLKRI